MILQLFKKKKEFSLERTYNAPIAAVWDAWTQAEAIKAWWGPKNTTVPECRVDARVDGEIYVVMEAGAGMGKYAGTRWPMAGVFTRVDPVTRMTYDARSWTAGEESTSTIQHTNDITLTEQDGRTTLTLDVTITQIGDKAKMAAFGMKMGYKAQLDKLTEYLSVDAG
ncbi:SRPBCC family protein [Mycolicibacterium diernhoferi]|uniref:ATPase n=1 Tax=Mycolicibacterium diernhoferi TaxID=1801 RepID=A0A1Q4HLL3_9MYCO|nr:SRPBCC domain-containing protein [Mycolicibacterium diernhoferi]OJZ68428.1 ATPase [Mycolicibacterium diernhoferi]OPE55245.1 ATPase [Mycolicibacterium diernhoferi]PEG52058.1 SRPBCC domain-containing protein [Mycolicibacterium diernhoferi]QYL21075.1 SRPBCC domain-containing protein [Mycolicibacterium diernhoferi]